MNDNKNSKTNLFAGLSGLVAKAPPGDKDVIVRVGAALEQALKLTGAETTLGKLVCASLETLQKLYEGTSPDPAGATQAVSGAMAAAELAAMGQVGGEAVIMHAMEALRRLTGAGTPQTRDDALSDVPSTSQHHALSDFVAQLMSLSAGDVAEIQKIIPPLTQIAGACTDAGAQRDISAAVDALRAAGSSSKDEAQAGLDSAAAFLDSAARRLEELSQNPQAVDSAVENPPAENSAAASQQAAPVIDPAASSAPAEAAKPAPKPAASKAPTPAPISLDAVLEVDDLELLKEYMTESLDHINAAEAALLTLETNPEDGEQINRVFRAFHTIKGTSGFLNLAIIQRLAHLDESMLDRARNGEIQMVGGYADLALRSCDGLKFMIQGLEGLSPGDKLPVPAQLDVLIAQVTDPESAGVSEETADDDGLHIGEILVGRGQVQPAQVAEALKQQGAQPIGEVLIASGAASATDVVGALRTQKKIAGPSANETTVRVGTDRLDSLINMVGEIVIAHSMVAQDPAVIGASPRLLRNVGHTGKIIRELQDLTMGLRMVPLKGTFQKMTRLVRDLAHKSGKSVRFLTEGDDTEIDRNMVEALNDPLIHMIRNSCDHGVESADARRAAGKEPTGTVRLCAYHSAGNVVIELADDGKGLDKQRIIAKAIDRGLIQPGAELSDTEAFNLIFLPGFSTAEKVTDVSGRGVGMDVVKKNVESLRGRVEIQSRAGAGTTFTIRLPLTMAITDGMLVRVGQERYLLPTVSIALSFRPTPGAVTTVTGRGEMVSLRGDLMPVFRLHELFGVVGAASNPCDGLLIVVEAEGKRAALMVDEQLGQQQVVIKSLGQSFGNLPGVSGGAILGDGRVGLILDVGGIVRLARESEQTLRGAA